MAETGPLEVIAIRIIIKIQIVIPHFPGSLRTIPSMLDVISWSFVYQCNWALQEDGLCRQGRGESEWVCILRKYTIPDGKSINSSAVCFGSSF